uniref:Uncharacterized protein n=1 Tax=Oryza brachyantha TaxID=4533 RepID=J3L183_ORYBR
MKNIAAFEILVFYFSLNYKMVKIIRKLPCCRSIIVDEELARVSASIQFSMTRMPSMASPIKSLILIGCSKNPT